MSDYSDKSFYSAGIYCPNMAKHNRTQCRTALLDLISRSRDSRQRWNIDRLNERFVRAVITTCYAHVNLMSLLKLSITLLLLSHQGFRINFSACHSPWAHQREQEGLCHLTDCACASGFSAGGVKNNSVSRRYSWWYDILRKIWQCYADPVYFICLD